MLFKYENIEIEYSLKKTDRKTFAAIVYPNLSVEIKTPIRATSKRIETFIQKHFLWIVKKQTYFKQFNPYPKPKEYVSGESFLYLGGQYKLVIEKTTAKEFCDLEGDLLKVYASENQPEKVKVLVEKWYTEKRAEIFQECLNKALEKFPEYTQIIKLSPRKMKRRWGSCIRKKNKITLNNDLIKASKQSITYVIIHELCHFKHPNHSKKFYAFLQSKIPDWKEIKSQMEVFLGNS